jgi:hypothetical protein
MKIDDEIPNSLPNTTRYLTFCGQYSPIVLVRIVGITTEVLYLHYI